MAGVSGQRRPKGTGSLTELRPGVWRLRVFLGKDLITGKPRQLERTHRGQQKTAARALRDLLAEVDEGKHLAADPTVAYLLEQWMAQRRRTGIRPTTIYTSESAIRTHLIPSLGALKVKKVTARDLDRHYQAMSDADLGDGTIRLHHNLMSGALRQAVRWGWLDRNPAANASPPKQPKTSRHAPTGEEIRRLAQLAEQEGDADLATLVTLAAITGARRGELCGLQWPDVDWQAGTVTFQRARVPTEEGDATGPLKSGDRRTVALGPLGVRILRLYRAVIDERAAQLGIDAPSDGWLLSYDCGREPMKTKAVTAAVTALGGRAKVKVTLHELRHYAATNMVAGGVDIRTAAARLGHAPEVLLRIYAHALPEQDRHAAELLAADLQGPVPAESRAIGG